MDKRFSDFVATVVCWLTVGVLFGLADGLITAYRQKTAFFYSYKLSVAMVSRKLLDKLTSALPSFGPSDRLYVPNVENMPPILFESVALAGFLALAGGVVFAVLMLAARRLPLRKPGLAGHVFMASLAFGILVFVMRPIQSRGDSYDYVAAVEYGGALSRIGIGVVVALLSAGFGFILLRRLQRDGKGHRVLRAAGVLGAVIWLVSVGGYCGMVWSAETLPHTVGSRPAQDGYPPVADSREPLNLVLISIDSVRADHLSSYGYQRPTSPNLDEIASQGVRFDRCLSAAPWTVPSHMSLLTSTYPSEHGLVDNFSRLGSGPTTLAETLAEAGYRTMAVVSALNVSSLYGFDRGFEEFDDDWSGKEGDRQAEKVTNLALDLLRSAGSEPFFLFVHYFDPHTTYLPPSPYDTFFTDPNYKAEFETTYTGLSRFTRYDVQMSAEGLAWVEGLYDGEIRYVDDQIGRIRAALDAADLSRRTVWSVSSDHGQEFKDHGSLFHRKTLYDEQLHVPWILSVPDGPSGVVVRPAVSSIDIAPTLLEVLGLRAPGSFRGRTLVELMSGGEIEPIPIFSETTEHLQRKAVIYENHKLVLSPYLPFVELYRLDSDPQELENIAHSDRKRSNRLREMLYEWYTPLRAQRQSYQSVTDEVELTEEQLRQLRALGYLQ